MTNVTPEYVTEIIGKFEMSQENKQSGIIGIEGIFLPFLFIFTPFFIISSVILGSLTFH